MSNLHTKEQLLSLIKEEQLHNTDILKKIFEERYLKEERMKWIFKGIEEALRRKEDAFEVRICVSCFFMNGPLGMWDFAFEDEIKDYFTKRWFFKLRFYDKKKSSFEVLEYFQDFITFQRDVDGLLEQILLDSNSIKRVLNELHQYSYKAKLVKTNKWVYTISISLT